MNYFPESISNKIWRKKPNHAEIESKLNQIDSSIKAIFERCRSKGMSNEEIAKIGFLVLKPSIFGSKLLPNVIKILTIILLIVGILSIEPINRLTYMYGRLMLFQVCFQKINS
jgi:hypothetical protein